MTAPWEVVHPKDGAASWEVIHPTEDAPKKFSLCMDTLCLPSVLPRVVEAHQLLINTAVTTCNIYCTDKKKGTAESMLDFEPDVQKYIPVGSEEKDHQSRSSSLHSSTSRLFHESLIQAVELQEQVPYLRFN